MKNLLVLVALIFISYKSFSKDYTPTSTIKNVTVYLNGASITRSASVNLPKGSHTLTFKGITTHIDPNSIQVNSNTQMTLLSIQHEINYLEDLKTPKRIKELEDTLHILTVQRQNEINGKASYEEELDFIKQNKNIKGNQTITIDDIEEFSALYRKLIPELKSKILISELLIDKLNKQIARVNKELYKHRSTVKQQESIIYVEIETDNTINGTIDVSYYTQSAYWTPLYDLRADQINSDIELTYKAKVVQTTGNDWENVQLKLSTGNPSLGGNAPELETWNLKYYTASKNKYKNVSYAYGYDQKRQAPQKAEEKQSEGEFFDSISLSDSNNDVDASIKSFSQNVGSTESGTNIFFNIDVPYTILSEVKGEMVEIQRSKINASYEYFVVPKMDPDAFLVARLTDWSHLNLIPGETSIFYEGNYVGTSFLDPYETNDTLNISLGRDNNVVVKRVKDDNKCKTGTFGTSKKHTVSWNITVKNNKTGNIKITVTDQIPVSNNKDIEVELTENENGDLDEKTGIIEWNFELASGEKKELKFTFTVKHPRKRTVVLN